MFYLLSFQRSVVVSHISETLRFIDSVMDSYFHDDMALEVTFASEHRVLVAHVVVSVPIRGVQGPDETLDHLIRKTYHRKRFVAKALGLEEGFIKKDLLKYKPEISAHEEEPIEF